MVGCVVSDNHDLDSHRFRLVEGFKALVKSDLKREIVKALNELPLANVPNIRRVRREFSERIINLPARNVIELALDLINDNLIQRLVAYELVLEHPSAPLSLNSRNVKLLGNGIDSWSAVDTFACYISGPAWREGLIPDSLIISWLHSKDRWWRRAGVVSTIALNNKARGGRGDKDRTLQICKLVIDDRDDMVVKALSWALRELSKKEKAAVESFITEYEKRLAPRVLREVKHKLQTGLKTPKLRRK